MSFCVLPCYKYPEVDRRNINLLIGKQIDTKLNLTFVILAGEMYPLFMHFRSLEGFTLLNSGLTSYCGETVRFSVSNFLNEAFIQMSNQSTFSFLTHVLSFPFLAFYTTHLTLSHLSTK